MNLKKNFLTILLVLNYIVLFGCGESVNVKIEKVDKMEILDVLMNSDVAAPKFVVDTTVDFVALTYDGTAQDGLLDSDFGTSYFQVGDNFQVLSMGYVLPLSFEIYNVLQGVIDENPSINLAAIDRVPNTHALDPAIVYLPLPNYEMNFGTFYEQLGFEFVLQFKLRHQITISMVGVNAALHGKTFRVPVFAKVLHNLDLKL